MPRVSSRRDAVSEGSSMSDWTFLTNHALVLSHLAKMPQITAHEVSLRIGITERTVRKVIADLDKEGYIVKSRQGRGISYAINSDRNLRHESHGEVVIGDFLGALGWQGR